MDDFGSYLGSTFGRLGQQVATNVAAQLDGVAVSFGQALRERGLGPKQDHPQQQEAGGAGRRQRGGGDRTHQRGRRSASTSAAGTPANEERGFVFDPRYQPTFLGAGASEGSSARGRRTTASSDTDDDVVMKCYCCEADFSLFSRKKQCHMCKKQFCSTCCPRDSQSRHRTCAFCKALLKIPPVRADLMKLPVKDLQRYLVSKHVNTKSCVEKKDLVELVIKENGGTPLSGSSRTGVASSASGLRGRDPIERQKSFPKSYTESTHRAEFLAKIESDRTQGDERASSSTSPEDELVRDFVVISPPGDTNNTSSTATTPTSQTVAGGHNATAVGDGGGDNSTASNNSSSAAASSSTAPQSPDSPAEAVPVDSGETPVSPTSPDTALPQNESSSETVLQSSEASNGQPKDDTNPAPPSSSLTTGNVASTAATASPSLSPRKFANQGVVYMSEITSEADLEELSVKQMKDILAMNRVTFKGVLEKEELLKFVRRLWKQEQKALEEKDNMEDSDLCKICMDNPVDCVMLECGHMCTCTNCGKQMNECPICRQYVVRVVKCFKS